MNDVHANGETGPAVGELEALYVALVKKFYARGDTKGAMPLAERLQGALESAGAASSIRAEEVRSVIAELRGELEEAIQYRQAEIRKILELHNRAANTRSWHYVARQYDHGDVSDRLDLLAVLFDRHGDPERAIATLRESQSYCEVHQVPFDGRELLDELLESEPSAVSSQGSVSADLLDKAIRRAYGRFGTQADDIVLIPPKSREFAAKVSRLLPSGRVSVQEVRRRLLALSRRSPARGGLPRLKKERSSNSARSKSR